MAHADQRPGSLETQDNQEGWDRQGVSKVTWFSLAFQAGLLVGADVAERDASNIPLTFVIPALQTSNWPCSHLLTTHGCFTPYDFAPNCIHHHGSSVRMSATTEASGSKATLLLPLVLPFPLHSALNDWIFKIHRFCGPPCPHPTPKEEEAFEFRQWPHLATTLCCNLCCWRKHHQGCLEKSWHWK